MANSNTLKTLMDELTEQKTELVDPLEGMRDFTRLATSPAENAMREAAQAAVRDYERRIEMIEGVLRAVGLLIADGYPEIQQRGVTADLYQQLVDNVDTVSAALKRFTPPSPPAATGTIDVGTSVPK